MSGDPDAAPVELQQLDLLITLVRAPDQGDQRFFAWLHLVLFQPSEIQLHLPPVGRLEPAELRLDGDRAAWLPMIEEQIAVEIVTVDDDPFLAGDEGEARPEFQSEPIGDTQIGRWAG